MKIFQPLELQKHFAGICIAYYVAKYNMSLFAMGMSEEFKGKIAVNAMWPVIPIWVGL